MRVVESEEERAARFKRCDEQMLSQLRARYRWNEHGMWVDDHPAWREQPGILGMGIRTMKVALQTMIRDRAAQERERKIRTQFPYHKERGGPVRLFPA